MKASEVLRRYQQGQRNFQRINLRGQSFKGANLLGVDFSECDIRGTNFQGANLTGAKLIEAKAGLQKQWSSVLLIAALLLIILSSFCSAIIGFLISFFLSENSSELVAGWVALATLIIFCLVTYCQGLAGGAFAGAFAVAVAGAFAVAGAGAVAFAVAGAFAVAFAGAGAGAFAVAGAGAGAVAGAGAGAGALFTCFLAYRSIKGDARDAWLRNLAVDFAATGGTSFYNATLTDADLTGATLKNSDLRAKFLTRTGFKDTVQLNLARVGKTLLSQPAVRDLLINPSIGYKKDYFKADLRGANLDGASLKEANLKQADLSEASLKGADLSGANLTEVNAISTDFTHVYLTGACIEAWNIDTTTKLDHIDCQYVFLQEQFNEHGSRERRPSSGDFQPGEFTKLFEEVLDTVDLIFRNGVDWKAFLAAMKQVQVQNEDTPLAIQSIEDKGDGVFVVKVQVSPGTNKEKIHQDFNQNYQLALEAVEAKYKAQLAAKDNEITIYRQQSINMMEITKTLANRPINVEAKAMTNSSDQSRTFTTGDIGGDFQPIGSPILADNANISGTVAETINQLPASPQHAQPGLKELLQQLKIAIDAPDLSTDDQQQALEQLKSLAEAAQNPKDETMQKKAKKAIGFLKVITEGLEPVSKLVMACKEIIPAIAVWFGL